MLRKPLRYKKLNSRTTLPVLREHEIDPNEYESLTTENQIATGVDAAEEGELHLVNALKSAGTTENEIPVPPPAESEEVVYEDLYATPFIEPRNYIKFSDTVEETLASHSLYDMTTEDDEYLKTYNSKKPAKEQLSEDDFERIMELFEDTASEQAPFAAVDNTVVSYETMVQHMARSVVSKLQTHTKQVYEYWKASRQESGNKPLHPTLKFETHQEADDMDPYVCFRRREVRQTRKTRARDTQVADKLKKLRRELEDARQLIVMAHQRELMKQETINTERLLFEHRAKLKEKKVRLGIKIDEEDLYNTKPPKRKAAEPPTARPAPHTSLRLAVRPVEQELTLLSDVMDEKYAELRRDVEIKIQTHKKWNQDYVDLTEGPLSPVAEVEEQGFRAAKAQFLPTPPASASDEMDVDEEPIRSLTVPKSLAQPFMFHGGTVETATSMPKYRRRIARGGRLFIDRRGAGRLASPPLESDDQLQSDRWKYDQDDSDDEQPVYEVDPFDSRCLKFRSTIPLASYRYQRQLAEANAAAAAAASAGGTKQALPAPPQSSGQAQPQQQQPAQSQVPAPPQAQPQSSAPAPAAS